jgi:elongation factor P
VARLPTTLCLPVEDAPGNIKSGANATTKGIGYKTAILPNGIRVEVPDFVLVGEIIEVSLDDNLNLTYSKRVR